MDNPLSTNQLSDQFGIANLLRFEAGRGGLRRAVVDHPSATGQMYLHGAHVTAWQPAGGEQALFISRASQFEHAQPIRGGAPVCFPWFGPKKDQPDAPMHGVARTQLWEVIDTADAQEGVSVHMRTTTPSFRLTHEATFGSQLRMTLHVENVGPARASFEQALHTYYRVGDVEQVEVAGLEEAQYLDKVQGMQRQPAAHQPIRFVGETDRIYLDTQATCVLRDPSLNRRITIEKENSDTTVVWNPWFEKAAAMEDFGDQEWRHMVCIETCNVGDAAVTLEPGESHRMTATVSVAADTS